MRDLVTHVPTGSELDLSDPNYGHPDGREIVRSLHGNMSRSDPQLLCAKHGSPLYLQMRPVHKGSNERQLWGIHFDGSESHRPSSGMSDEHKRQTEYLVRAGESAGFRTDTEVRLPTKVRPDAIIYGQEDIAVEVQRSHLTRSAAISRTKKAVAGGVSTSIWFSDRDASSPPTWFFGVPSISMNQLPWDVLPEPRSATVTTGLRIVKAVRCKFPEYNKCPKTRRKPCGGYHPQHDPWMGMTLDDVAERSPLGEIIPIRFLGKEIILVSRQSKALYDELIGGASELIHAAQSNLMAAARSQPGRIECASPEEDAEFVMVNPPVEPTFTNQPATWAGRNLGHLPGRCRSCGWHIQKQGHADQCSGK